MVKISKKEIAKLVAVILLAGCANQLPPGGGEVDKIPPEVVEVYPPDGTINYDEDYFEVDFSEYVDKRSFKDALFISPFAEGRLNYDWTGTGVTIEFTEGLKKNTTYTITIGTDVVDRNNRNRMAESFTFSFSTGNQIDKNSISGKVYGSNKEGVLIFAYKITETNKDTLLNGKPDYISQTGNDGSYKLTGLAPANYRIFAVKDEFRDLIYDLNQDMMGIPPEDILFTTNDTSFTGLNFRLFKADTTAPRMLKAIMTDERHILLSLSEAVNGNSVNRKNFFLFDSTAAEKSGAEFVYRRINKKDELVIVADKSFPPDNYVYLTAKSLTDSSGNSYKNDFINLTISDKPDTTAPSLVLTVPPKNSSSVDFNHTQINYYFDDAFLKENLQKSITFSDTLGRVVPFKILQSDDATLSVAPLRKLKPDKNYRIKIDLSAVKDFNGNVTDSVYVYEFKTISALDFTGVSGKVININFDENPVIVLQNVDDPKIFYEKELESFTFGYKRIVAGKYILWCYLDKIKNDKYDFGWPQPIKYAERFSFYSDTLKLKPRWEITDVKFEYK